MAVRLRDRGLLRKVVHSATQSYRALLYPPSLLNQGHGRKGVKEFNCVKYTQIKSFLQMYNRAMISEVPDF